MSGILRQIQRPNQLKDLDKDKLAELADELREEIIKQVSRTGGHLASNLGVVELTMAIARAFDFEAGRDQVIFDVGHQSYVWKLITGRQELFPTLRQLSGLSGFPKRSESPYDYFETGHASTSISAALGISRAKRIAGEPGKVIAICGDGAITGGMAFEALNDLRPDDDVIVILNDNEMSIAPNVGALAKRLGELRIKNRYQSFKTRWRPRLEEHPKILNKLRRFKSLDRLLYRRSGIFFESLNWRYYGPIDGHDTEKIEEYLNSIKNIPGGKILHIYSVKGKGYSYAEAKPESYHGVGQFAVEEGVVELKSDEKTFSTVFGEQILQAAAVDPRIVAITAAMPGGTGLSPFAKLYPKRFFDVGIAEQHAACLAAGLAAGGCLPVLALYSTFMQRAVDQIIHDIALQELPVMIALDRAGLVPNDGATHQGVYDFSILANLPQLDYFEARDARDVEAVFASFRAAPRPLVLRYPKAQAVSYTDLIPIEQRLNSYKIHSGDSHTLLLFGHILREFIPFFDEREQNNVLGDCFTMSRLERSLTAEILASLRKTRRLVVCSESLKPLSFGAFVLAQLAEAKIDVEFMELAIPEGLDYSGNRQELLEKSGLNTFNIHKKLLLFLMSNLK